MVHSLDHPIRWWDFRASHEPKSFSKATILVLSLRLQFQKSVAMWMVRWGYCGIWWNQKWMILVLSTVYSYYQGIVMPLASTFFFWKSLLQFIIITPLDWCVKVKQRQTVCLLAQKKGIFCRVAPEEELFTGWFS